MDAYLSSLRATQPAPGHSRVVYAGVGAVETAADREANGVPYHPEVVAYFSETLEWLGLADRFAGVDLKGWTKADAIAPVMLPIKERA